MGRSRFLQNHKPVGAAQLGSNHQGLLSDPPLTRPMKIVDCGILIDGLSEEPIHEGRMLIRDGQIEEIGPEDSISAPSAAEMVDYSDRVVMPGMIDAHVHLLGAITSSEFDRIEITPSLGAARATSHLREQLKSGFTSIRDCGSRPGLALKQSVAEETIPGPRIYTAGVRFSQTAGHGDRFYLPHEWVDSRHAPGYSEFTDGVEECRKGVRKRLREGVDLIKIMTSGGMFSRRDSPHDAQFTPEEIQVFTEEAHRFGVPVACHAQGTEGIKLGVENGVDTIEHAIYLDDEAIEKIKENDVTIVSTLVLSERFLTGEEVDLPDFTENALREAQGPHKQSLREAHEAGVQIALGTDTVGHEVNPYGESAREAELFVEELGMTPMEAIQSSTGNAGETVNDEKLGGLAPGKYADFLVLEKNPLEDISAIRDINSVFKDGEKVSDGDRIVS